MWKGAGCDGEACAERRPARDRPRVMPSLLADNDGVLLREVGEWRIRALHAALKLP
eukprot:COSAG01_NODE_19323_length_1017_cov_1.795207_1_plen_55_part_10